jgi:hypothetical protein
MEKAVGDGIKLLAAKITKEVKSEDALRFTQAALNLAHVLATEASIEQAKASVRQMIGN